MYTHEQNNHAGDAVSNEIQHLQNRIDKRKIKQKKIKYLVLSLLSLVAVLLIFVVYFRYKLSILSKEEAGVSISSPISGTTTPAQLLEAVSRHILVPVDDPQIAKIEDISKLKDTQYFFRDADNGDVVFVFKTVIIIYRPSVDKIIAVGDLSGTQDVRP